MIFSNLQSNGQIFKHVSFLVFWLQLSELGFTNIDALEPCPAYIDAARKTGIYKNCYEEFLGANKLSIENGKKSSFKLDNSVVQLRDR